ncbi:uncharacterized protein LOC108162869 [Drosophila miranda]|uniref:uncharacterized protein LOC108162869 n=1 Tax=Drosophila miranda TaxID=7229 RepID=UPI0007E776A0|nr:uncharacterized protein LOC108162869 [Drosophila miranda]
MDPQRATTKKVVREASSEAEGRPHAETSTPVVQLEDAAAKNEVPPAAVDSLVVHLKDATVGSTETDVSPDVKKEPEASCHLDEMPSTSQKGTVEGQKPESGRPEGRLNHLIDMLDHFTIRLDVIEEKVRREDEECLDLEPVTLTVDSGTAVIIQIPEICELGTQTVVTRPPRRQRVEVKAIPTAPPSNQPDTRAPCERTHHTIQIRSNNNRANAAAEQGPPSLGARIVRTLGDFGAAFCLCLQINKDCIFCLGFFVAFVVSASFLTAFFYRTLNLTSAAARAPGDAFGGATGSYDVATLRFNGGYYYIYNRQRQQLQ